MNPPSMESIFMILSGAILIAGVLYWLWSHIQLTQKKVQLLENAVFELRSMLAARGTEPPAAPVQVKTPSIYNDLEDDDWREPEKAPLEEVAQVSTPIDAPELLLAEVWIPSVNIVKECTVTAENNDLAPGAPRTVHVDETVEVASDKDSFRELFASMEPPAAVTSGQRSPESLESMPVKELRRLAIQRGIADADSMRKKEILAALRQQITSADVLVMKAVEVETDEAAPAVEAEPLDTATGTDIAEILE